MAKPFVKWVGGKRQLLPELLSRVPENFDIYFENFLGGGALFFELEERGLLKNKVIVLNDFCFPLINAFIQIRDNLDKVLAILRYAKNTEDDYYRMRDCFNAFDRSSATTDDLIRYAAWFLYIMRLCYNGLYRENLSGKFNAPYGKYPASTDLVRESTLRPASEALQGVLIYCDDFAGACDKVVQSYLDGQRKLFMYCDPPYIPVTTTSFTKYNKHDFGIPNQERLAAYALDMAKNGYVLLSNSDTPTSRQIFTSEISTIEQVWAKRAVNCDGEGRGKVAELLIKVGY